jgi:hypothetical protein
MKMRSAVYAWRNAIARGGETGVRQFVIDPDTDVTPELRAISISTALGKPYDPDIDPKDVARPWLYSEWSEDKNEREVH